MGWNMLYRGQKGFYREMFYKTFKNFYTEVRKCFIKTGLGAEPGRMSKT